MESVADPRSSDTSGEAFNIPTLLFVLSTLRVLVSTTKSPVIVGEDKVLLVKVSVVALPTRVSVDGGSVRITLPLYEL